MISYKSIPFIPHRKKPAPPPAALVLTGVAYMAGIRVRLIFDRAINIAALNPAQITVKDFDESLTFQGQAPVSLVDFRTVEISLGETGSYFGAGVLLSATASSGIVATDGGAWAGVTNVAIPF
jgi:F0F1-type ATP synthase membrane subunit c/vacuolar-type H+-ATPase subunit K